MSQLFKPVVEAAKDIHRDINKKIDESNNASNYPNKPSTEGRQVDSDCKLGCDRHSTFWAGFSFVLGWRQCWYEHQAVRGEEVRR